MQDMKKFQEQLIEKNKYLSNQVSQLQYKLQLYENNQNYTSYKTYIPPQQQYDNTKEEPQYSIKHEKNHTLKNIISLLLTILIVFIVFIVLWFIPFTHNFLVNIYINNSIIKTLVDFFI